MSEVTKTCSKCGVEKPLTEFQWRKDHNAPRADCKVCCKIRATEYRKAHLEQHNARTRAWARANPEKARASVRAWELANPERHREANRKWQREHPETARAYRVANAKSIRARVKKWQENNREKSRAWTKAWALANPEKQKARSQRWYKNNSDKSTAKTQWRQAQKLRATPVWANEFFIDEAYHLAKLRTEATGFKWHVDHIVPLRSKLVCGLHWEGNLQVIPAVENMKKHNRYWPDMPTEIRA